MPETKGQGEKKAQSAPPPQPKEAHEHEEVWLIYYPQVFTEAYLTVSTASSW
ncbi:hypothetical protein NW761_008332 [Fusarium oxysporum]|uniref:Uncharacterized protein n=1 Tax=Fusarium oxysporum f. sp. pisi HDV247 TaxID=1080344 RepID=W9NQP1_FUSOX|nr:hypothetical protein FOVG_13910 [Fusarium oxysporum f. sp. pisi HDV247]KAJ4086712.1 hypothetical protein NW761_008332 [Fusarium oxysporum]KAJ4103970.1 hypothetical protein NW769_009661 [Fusarium oxysporum]KAJ4222958.1 hypothetical protein NW760_010645 [Fusarium oxysporum]WKT52516.1 hypothetical protein QSH57_003030 [Fusarium oxysporum f. sp. vasinfectum]